MDFAKIVELFDRHGVSFVAVTQQFNTTTSMGRLTLNILLSFAQFEREVIGERVRDAASPTWPSTRSAAWRSKTWSRAAGCTAGCETSAPARGQHLLSQARLRPGSFHLARPRALQGLHLVFCSCL